MAADPTDSDSANPLTSEEAKAAEAEAKKNHVYEVVFGSLLLKPRERCDAQYPSDFLGQNTDRLYVCQWCFKYTKELVPFLQHLVSWRTFFHACLHCAAQVHVARKDEMKC